jgi:hypothetical protein
MFATEQYTIQGFKNRTKKAVFETGMSLANRKAVKRRFTYRELTLIVGVVVALIVAFTLFLQSPSAQSSYNESLRLNLPNLTTPAVKVVTVVQEILTEIFIR